MWEFKKRHSPKHVGFVSYGTSIPYGQANTSTLPLSSEAFNLLERYYFKTSTISLDVFQR